MSPLLDSTANSITGQSMTGFPGQIAKVSSSIPVRVAAIALEAATRKRVPHR